MIAVLQRRDDDSIFVVTSTTCAKKLLQAFDGVNVVEWKVCVYMLIFT